MSLPLNSNHKLITKVTTLNEKDINLLIAYFIFLSNKVDFLSDDTKMVHFK